MYSELFSPCKLNMSLRITSVRPDGFHDLVSLFFRVPQVERLTIKELGGNNVNDNIITHNFSIDGENILATVLDIFRKKGCSIPALEIEIFKHIPPGTGLGGGSGNASALLEWVKGKYGYYLTPEDLGSIGADVAFLDSGLGLALVKGTGDRFCCRKIKKGLSFMVFVPAWSSATREAYNRLDRYFLEGGFPKTESEAVLEAEDLVCKIGAGISVGQLPNDFLPVLMQDRPEYGELFDLLEDTSSIAWGVTGSGSAAFAIFNGPPKEDTRDLNRYFSSLSWLRKTFLWSDDQ